MSNSKENRRPVRQNEKTILKSQKHDANLTKNSTLYFQIGLILCLLASYTALEMTFATNIDSYVYKEKPDDRIYEIVPEKFIIEKVPKAEKTEPIKLPKDPNDFKIVDNDTKIKDPVEDLIKISEPKKPINIVDADDFKVKAVVDEGPFNIMAVQKVPIYPGCESAKNNEERRQCMSEKLGKLIQRKFDNDLGGELGLSGKQTILVAFKINKNGEVEIQKVHAPHADLEKEAKRVVNKIPKMQLGKNNDKPVNVSYKLPITFKGY